MDRIIKGYDCIFKSEDTNIIIIRDSFFALSFVSIILLLVTFFMSIFLYGFFNMNTIRPILCIVLVLSIVAVPMWIVGGRS